MTDLEARAEQLVDAIKAAWDSQPDVDELEVALDPEVMLDNAARVALNVVRTERSAEQCSECEGAGVADFPDVQCPGCGGSGSVPGELLVVGLIGGEG